MILTAEDHILFYSRQPGTGIYGYQGHRLTKARQLKTIDQLMTHCPPFYSTSLSDTSNHTTMNVIQIIKPFKSHLVEVGVKTILFFSNKWQRFIFCTCSHCKFPCSGMNKGLSYLIQQVDYFYEIGAEDVCEIFTVKG